MSFLCVQIRPLGKATDEFSYVSTTEEGQIIEENLDLGLDNYVPARCVMIRKYNAQQGSWSTIAEIEDKLPVDVYITASRFVVLCKKYDKGDTWYGDPLSSLIMTGIERAVASVKRKNKILTGQLRYEWIEQILYSRKLKWSENETLCIHYRDTEKTLYRLVIWFNKDIESSFIANEILHKACRYRLSMNDEKTSEEISFFKKYLVNNIEHDNNPKMMSSIKFPTKYFAPMGEQFRPTIQQLSGNMLLNDTQASEHINKNQIACPYCNAFVQDNDKFCMNCGNTMSNVDSQNCSSDINNVDKNKLLCTNCGSQLDLNDKFCMNCGSQISGFNENNYNKDQQKIKLCSQCGSQLQNDYVFCPECGVKVE